MNKAKLLLWHHDLKETNLKNVFFLEVISSVQILGKREVSRSQANHFITVLISHTPLKAGSIGI